MHFRKFILVSFLLTSSLIRAGEVSENTDNDAFSTLLDSFKEVSTNISENGTIRLTGHLAEKVDAQVVTQVQLSREESARADFQAMAQEGNRSPAIVSADSIISGELEPVDYPSYGIPSNNLDNEIPLKNPTYNVGGLGNFAGVASTLNKFTGGGKLPIPYRVAPNSVGAGGSKAKGFNEGGTPYEEKNSGTTFGEGPSDESISSLLKQKKNTDLQTALEKENQDLDKLDDEENKKKEQEKKEKDFKDKMSKIKEFETPYTQDDYNDVRDLFNGDSQFAKMLDKDPDFQEKAFEIFNFKPENSNKTLGEADADTRSKRKYVDFVDGFDPETTRFPATPPEEQNRIRTEKAH